MKKLFILLAVFCFAFMACSNGSNDSGNSGSNSNNNVSSTAYKNNATDDMFSVTNRTTSNGRNWFMVFLKDEKSKDWNDTYRRKNGTTGIIGEWELVGEYTEEILTFKNDGTFESVYTKSVYSTSPDNYIRTFGEYKVYESNGTYRMEVTWSGRKYDFEYVVSDTYFCPEENGII